MKKLFLLVALMPAVVMAADQNKSVVKVDLKKTDLLINRTQKVSKDERQELEQAENILRWRYFDLSSDQALLERLTAAVILAQKDAKERKRKEIQAMLATLESSHLSEDRKEGEGSN